MSDYVAQASSRGLRFLYGANSRRDCSRYVAGRQSLCYFFYSYRVSVKPLVCSEFILFNVASCAMFEQNVRNLAQNNNN